MYQQASLALAIALASSGCAILFPPLDPGAASVAEQGTQPAPAADTPVKEVDISRIPPRPRCENLTRGGSRIVVAQRCRAPGDDGVDELAVAEQLERVREDQEELDRRRREVEARRGPGL